MALGAVGLLLSERLWRKWPESKGIMTWHGLSLDVTP
jgi:hypothetical protein